MDDTILAKDAEVGLTVIYEGCEATVIRNVKGENTLLGFMEQTFGAWEIRNTAYNSVYKLTTSGFEYGYWVMPSEKLTIKNKVIHPNQVCADCKLPAHHSKPNIEDKFICIGCSAVAGLAEPVSSG